MGEDRQPRRHVPVPVLFVCGFQTVAAQQLEPVSASVNTRDVEYDQLAEEVAWLEQKGNLLKKVVRLVTPTVVHIEAEKAAQPGHATVAQADRRSRFGRVDSPQ